ncbi:MAG: hypothetical protein LBI64_06860, partial [Coriobacteriales bacterium]|nr:hypothetical protein [Coriobacteriales bacterium]
MASLQPEYKTACVTYLDILGFKSIVDDIYSDDAKPVKAVLDMFAAEQSVADTSSPIGLLVSHKPTVAMGF